MAGKDRTVFGKMEIRRRTVNPRKAANIREYAKAVNEWDADIDKLWSYAGADSLPHAHVTASAVASSSVWSPRMDVPPRMDVRMNARMDARMNARVAARMAAAHLA